jgi:hypothetical protein
MILRWSPFKIVSVSAVLYPRWPPLLKIEFFSNGQNCSILSQKVPKFELYKHNDELFKIYYGIFKELWTFTDFNRLCKLEKRGNEIKKKSSLKLLSQSRSKGRTAGHIFGREPSNDYFIKILFLLSKWFQTKIFLWEFPIGSYVKLSSAVAAILVGVLKWWTQFWKRTTQESFQQSLVEIGSIVSEKIYAN